MSDDLFTQAFAIDEGHRDGVPVLKLHDVEEYGLGMLLQEFDDVEELLEYVADEVQRTSALITAVDTFLGIRRCRVCGCTDDDCSVCVERTGVPCSWRDDLETEAGSICSACVPEERPRRSSGLLTILGSS